MNITISIIWGLYVLISFIFLYARERETVSDKAKNIAISFLWPIAILSGLFRLLIRKVEGR